MYVRHLSVADFRSWPAAELELQPGPVVLLGANGQGKTNLVEALGYLATLDSHRAAADAPLVRSGAERAVIRAAVAADGRELRVEVEIAPGRSNRARLNGAPVRRPRDILGAVRTILFAPEDLAIVRGDPAERRRFLDGLVVARRPSMAGVRADYERVLRQRAALLKSAGAARRSDAQLHALDAWDEHLAEHGAQVLHARLETVRDLRGPAAAAYAFVAPSAQPLGLAYQSGLAEVLPEVRDPDLVPDVATLRAGLLEQAAGRRADELDRGVNLVGPHRDDLDLRLGELTARGFASQGESWSIALALRLGSYELVRADGLPGGDPVLMLDDVFAQLDTERRDQLALVAGKAEQVIVTAAVPDDVPEQLAALRYRLAGGRVTIDD